MQVNKKVIIIILTLRSQAPLWCCSRPWLCPTGSTVSLWWSRICRVLGRRRRLMWDCVSAQRPRLDRRSVWRRSALLCWGHGESWPSCLPWLSCCYCVSDTHRNIRSGLIHRHMQHTHSPHYTTSTHHYTPPHTTTPPVYEVWLLLKFNRS